MSEALHRIILPVLSVVCISCTRYLPVAEEEPMPTEKAQAGRGAIGASEVAGTGPAELSDVATPNVDISLGRDDSKLCGLKIFGDYDDKPLSNSGSATLTTDGISTTLSAGACALAHDVAGTSARYYASFLLEADDREILVDVKVDGFKGDGMYSGRFGFPSASGGFKLATGPVMLTQGGMRGSVMAEDGAMEFECGADAELDPSPVLPYEQRKPGLNEVLFRSEDDYVYKFVNVACHLNSFENALVIDTRGLVDGRYQFRLETEEMVMPGTVEGDLVLAFYDVRSSPKDVELTFECGDEITGTFRGEYNDFEGAFRCARP